MRQHITCTKIFKHEKNIKMKEELNLLYPPVVQI